MKTRCSADLKSKPFFNLLIKIMVNTKQLLTVSNSNVPAPSNKWDDIMNIFLTDYKTRLFFNRSLFGGNKTKYEKIRGGVQFNYDDKNQDSNVTFSIDRSSLLFNKVGSALPPTIISMNSNISPLGECVLSICEEVNQTNIKTKVKVALTGSTCKNDFFEGAKALNEEEVFKSIKMDVEHNTASITVNNAFPKMEIAGYFSQIARTFDLLVEPKRKNEEIAIDMKLIHEKSIRNSEFINEVFQTLCDQWCLPYNRLT